VYDVDDRGSNGAIGIELIEFLIHLRCDFGEIDDFLLFLLFHFFSLLLFLSLLLNLLLLEMG